MSAYDYKGKHPVAMVRHAGSMEWMVIGPRVACIRGREFDRVVWLSSPAPEMRLAVVYAARRALFAGPGA